MLKDITMIFNLAQAYFHNFTCPLEDTKQYRYLRSIGYEKETIESLNPGYGGEGAEGLINFLIDHNADPDMVTGLEFEDASNKIILTRYGKNGEITGFSCRVMDETTLRKYKVIKPLESSKNIQEKAA